MLVDMIRLLPRDEFSPEVAVFEGGGSLEAPLAQAGIPVHHLNKRDGIDLGLLWRLRRLLGERDIRIVHSHNFSAWLYSSIGAFGLNCVRHIHTEHSGVEAFQRRYAAERWLSRLTYSVVAVSKHVHEVMINEIGISPERVKLVYNGVNTTRFAPNQAVRLANRKALGLDDADIAIGIVARLAPVKNHRHLLRSFAQLARDATVPVKLFVVGDGSERMALELLCRDLGIATCVSFLGERRDTEALLNALDIYVLPSLSEGMNLTLLEAMSTGLPVVATAVGGNGEIVIDGTTGYLVPLGDETAMRDRLRDLALDEPTRRHYASAGRESVIERFDERKMIDQYLGLYRQTRR